MTHRALAPASMSFLVEPCITLYNLVEPCTTLQNVACQRCRRLHAGPMHAGCTRLHADSILRGIDAKSSCSCSPLFSHGLAATSSVINWKVKHETSLCCFTLADGRNNYIETRIHLVSLFALFHFAGSGFELAISN